MKKQKNFLLSLLLGFILSFSPILAIIEGGKFEWKKPEEPKKMEEAIKMKDQAIQERKDALDIRKEAESMKKEAEEKGDEETAKKDEELIKEAKLKFQEARYKYQTGDLAIAKFNLEKGINVESAKKTINRATAEREKIEKEITSLQNKLASGYEPPLDTKQFSISVKDFKDNMEFAFSNVSDRGEPIKQFIDQQYYQGTQIKDNGLPNYEDQKNALNVLRDFLDEKVTKDRKKYFEDANLSQEEKNDYYQTSKEMTDRLNKINDFLSNPPNKIEDTPLANNTLANSLSLDKKISTDQIASIRRAINDKLKDTTLSDQEKIDFLKEATEVLDYYKLKDKNPDLANFYDDAAKSLAPKEKGPLNPLNEVLSKGMETVQEKIGDFVDAVSDPANATNLLAKSGEEIGNFVRFAIEANPAFFDPAFEEVAGIGKQLADTAEKFEKGMNQAPDLVSYAIRASKLANTPIVGPKLIEPALKSAIGEKGVAILKVISDPRAQPIAKSAASGAEKLAPYVKKIGELGKNISERANEERIKLKGPEAKEKLQRVKTFIEKERFNYLTPEKRNKFAQVFDSISNFAKDVGSWIKDNVSKIVNKVKFDRAIDKYNNARKAYLDTLKLTPEATEEQISGALKAAKQDPSLQEEIDKKNKNLAQATYDLGQMYKEFAEKLNGIYKNIEFMIKAWDGVYYDVNAKTDLIGLIDNLIFVRDQQLSELEAMSNAVESIKNDLDTITQGTDFQGLNEEFTNNITNMLSGQMIKTISDYDNAIGAFDEALRQPIGFPAGPPG